jgi:hypothetical protein
MLRSLPAPLAAIVVAGLIATPGLAETAEEAVAYVFMGLADGAESDRGPTHITWRAGSSSPAVFFGHGEAPDRAYDVTFTVTALSPCRYEVQDVRVHLLRIHERLAALEQLAGISTGSQS